MQNAQRFSVTSSRPMTAYEIEKCQRLVLQHRRRQKTSEATTDADEVSEGILQAARELKDQTLAANRLIRQDMNELRDMTSTTESLTEEINVAREELLRKPKGWNWLAMLIILLVFTVFVGAVLLIRFFKKNK